jgi:hypothetical protein
VIGSASGAADMKMSGGFRSATMLVRATYTYTDEEVYADEIESC